MINVTIFAYKRHKNLERLLDFLNQLHNKKVKNINIYIDKSLKKDEDNEKVFKLVDNIKYKKDYINIFKREKHFGLKNNLILGITDTLQVYNSALFLEEDLEISDKSFDFIEKYSNILSPGKIMHLSLFTPIKNKYSYLTRLMFCWGWYTNFDCWNYFIKDIKMSYPIKSIDYPFSKFFSSTYINNQNKKINSWAISWYVSIFENNGYCLNPPANLVLNNGFDELATHTKTSSSLLLPKMYSYDAKIDKFPNLLKEDIKNRYRIGLYFFIRTNILTRIVSKIIYIINNLIDEKS